MKQVWISVHDFQQAQICREAQGVDVLLVGDSLGMVMYGFESTREVTMEMMLRHSEAVIKAAQGDIPVIADMPFGSYKTPELALENAKRFQKIGIDHLKLEGGEEIIPQIEILLSHGFVITGHLGLLPQTAEKFSVVGKEEEEAEHIFQDAIALQQAGVSSLVLECIPEDLGKRISEVLDIPVIGIGAGRYTDGQILVYSDVVGRTSFKKKPKFLRVFSNTQEEEKLGIQKFSASVRSGEFPNISEVY